MTPLYFGPPSQRLFGMLHAPERDPGERPAVLMGRPFGHEAIRSQRIYRVLADRLARQGHWVLRFDWHGTGDSAGDDADVRLARWSDDLRAAQCELAHHAGARPQCWLAARLGATAALLALCGAGPLPASVLLWDPVLDGAAYLASLRVAHVQTLEGYFQLPDPSWRRALEADPEAFVDEAIGFAIDPELRREVLAVTPATLRLPAALHAVVVAGPQEDTAAPWAAAQTRPPLLLRLERDFDWNADDSLNTALVPTEALTVLLRGVAGG